MNDVDNHGFVTVCMNCTYARRSWTSSACPASTAMDSAVRSVCKYQTNSQISNMQTVYTL